MEGETPPHDDLQQLPEVQQLPEALKKAAKKKLSIKDRLLKRRDAQIKALQLKYRHLRVKKNAELKELRLEIQVEESQLLYREWAQGAFHLYCYNCHTMAITLSAC